MVDEVGIGSSFAVNVVRTVPTITDWLIFSCFIGIIIILVYFGIKIFISIRNLNKEDNVWLKQDNADF